MKKELILVLIMGFVVLGSFAYLGFRVSSGISGSVVYDGEVLGDEGKVLEGDNFENQVVEEEVRGEVEEEILEEVIEKGFVSKVIDGDTVVVNGENVRLLGIDTDERGYPCYDEGSERMEELVLNKEVKLISDGEDKDQYDRYLRYLFVEDVNVNLKMVEEGLAIARFFPDNKKYKLEILEGEKEARESKRGCKWEEVEYEDSEEDYVEFGGEVEEECVDGGDVVCACNSGKYLGEEKVVEGKVVDVYRSESDTVFMNFEKPYPRQCFTAVIFKSGLSEFPDYESYDGKRVRVRGVIKEYEGRAEIILEEQEQVEVLD